MGRARERGGTNIKTIKSYFPSTVQNQFKYTDSLGITILPVFTIVLQASQYVSDWDVSFCLRHLFILLLSIGAY